MIPNNIDNQFRAQGCSELLIKRLSPNDNSKNQVYLGGSFEILSTLHFGKVSASQEGGLRDRFKASLDFYWLIDGEVHAAPHSQLVLYPKYPEVRMSGFLRGCEKGPNSLMKSRANNRVLFVSNSWNGRIIGMVTDDVHVNDWFDRESSKFKKNGVFSVLNIDLEEPEIVLLDNLRRIHSLGWLEGKRFNKNRALQPCYSSNCGGYTLESELGISPNGFSEPDFMGYEIKSFLTKGKTYTNSVLTVVTPEPTGGSYRDGLKEFIGLFGYPDKLGRENRWNFGGIHKFGIIHPTTKLRLTIKGFDLQSQKILDSNGAIQLLDQAERVAAEWSFSGLIEHWARKHRRACYVPYIRKKELDKIYFSYSSIVHIGEGTDFIKFLNSCVAQFIYYDPALKIVFNPQKIESKKRNQFRMKFQNLHYLYYEFKEVNLLSGEVFGFQPPEHSNY